MRCATGPVIWSATVTQSVQGGSQGSRMVALFVWLTMQFATEKATIYCWSMLGAYEHIVGLPGRWSLSETAEKLEALPKSCRAARPKSALRQHRESAPRQQRLPP